MSVATSPILGRPLWYELMTTDPSRAEAFYTTVVGWTASSFGGAAQPYTMLGRAPDAPVAGLMGRPEGMDAPPFWAMYVGVPKLEDGVARVKQLGGAECSPVIDIANIGRMQMMTDPQGAAFYLYEPATTELAAEGRAEVGEVAWIELMTTDAPAAMRFYADLFGWTESDAMDMGPMGKYHLFNRPHGMIGGMMNKSPEMAEVPANWGLYFRVADLDAAIVRLKANGGQVLNGPMEVPGGDRIVNALDPQGAAFSLYEAKA
jgi:predicted enzyme related to lactoylglutathione lyase